MLEARRKPWFETLLYHAVVRPQLTSSFARVSFRMAAPLPGPDMPLLLYGNHSSWWDAHTPFTLNRLLLKRELYVMVEHAQLARYPFFRWAGGFSVDRADARSAQRTLAYAAGLLSGAPNRCVLIYPQGEILANDRRPLQFFSGAGHLVKGVLRAREVCALAPVALRYEFIGEQRPELFASIGAPMLVSGDVSPKALSEHMAATLTAELDALRDDVVAYRLGGFQTLLRGGASINRMFDRVLGRGQISEVGRR